MFLLMTAISRSNAQKSAFIRIDSVLLTELGTGTEGSKTRRL